MTAPKRPSRRTKRAVADNGRFSETDSLAEQADLTPQEASAIGALMASRTLEDAAKQCSVPERTLRRWLTERTDFRSALLREQRAAMACVTSRLQHGASKALDTLEAVMGDGNAPASARVSAARAMLELAQTSLDLADLAARLERIEADRNGGALQ